MLVSDVMHACTIVDAGEAVSEVAKLMDEHLTSAVLVRKDGVITGIMTERDILRKVVAKGKDPEHISIGQVMSMPLVTISENASLLEASELMEQKGIRRLVVTVGEQIRGIVNTTTISNNMKYITARDRLYARPSYKLQEIGFF